MMNKGRKIAAAFIVAMFISACLPTAVSTFAVYTQEGESVAGAYSQNSNGVIDIDTEFISDIIYELTDITSNPENENWLGREYGTPGEQYAAELLKDAWNDYISNDNIDIDNAVLDKIDKGPFAGIDDKYGVHSREDYELVIYRGESREEIPDSECFPVLPIPSILGIPFESEQLFQNAVVHIAPDEIYKTSSGNTKANDFDNSGDNSPLGNGVKHIYLIEMKNFRENKDKVKDVANDLYEFTDKNSDYPLADAFLCADSLDNVHREIMNAFLPPSGILWGEPLYIPGFMIDGSLGNQINESITDGIDVTADFALHAFVDRSVTSHNVIGTIPGQLDDKTIVIGAHYDSGWGQCAIDNAVGVGIMFGIAKYFSDYFSDNPDIKPYYTLKFVAAAGEESCGHGVRHYIWENHDNEEIQYYINLDALGYINGDYPKIDLSLNFWFHPRSDELKGLLQGIADKSNYQDNSGGYSIKVQGTDDDGIDRCDGVYFKDVVKKAVICFDKGEPSLAKHWYTLDGEGHTKGDTTDKIDWQDVYYATPFVILDTIFALNENQEPPVADAGGSYTGTENQPILFDASGSTDSNGDVLQYMWDWTNDGSWDTNWLDSLTEDHTYDQDGDYTVKLQVREKDTILQRTDIDTASVTVQVVEKNAPPIKPDISGPASGNAGEEYDYTFVATDPDGHDVKYFIDWGDGDTEWTSSAASGTSVTRSHTWATKGTYTIKAKAKDIHGAESEWGTLTITRPNNGNQDQAIISKTVIQAVLSHPVVLQVVQALQVALAINQPTSR